MFVVGKYPTIAMIKKNLLALALLILSFTAQSQITKGKVLLGGNINMGSQSTSVSNDTTSYDDGKAFNLNVGPSVGVFISDNVVLGINGSYGRSNQDRYINDASNQRILLNTHSRSFAAGPFIRFYKTLAAKLYLYGELQGSYGQQKFYKDELSAGSNTIIEDVYTVKQYSITAIPGLTYLVTNKFGLELSFGGIGYNAYSTEGKDSGNNQKTNTYSVNLNPFNLFFNNIVLGGRFYLGE